jgi:hypothetical protein
MEIEWDRNGMEWNENRNCDRKLEWILCPKKADHPTVETD